MCSFSLSLRHLLVAVFVCLSIGALAAGLPEGSVSVTNVSPNTGDVAGGTAVTITGTGFATGASVTFGGTAATGVSVMNATTISCTTPAHALGAVTVTVTNTDTSSASLPGGFTYTTTVPAPTVTSVNPTSGPTTGATAVTITGTGFATSGVVTVTFGGTAATGISVGSASSITCTTPSHAAGAVDVVVTNPDTQSSPPLAGGFTYTASAPAPTVTSVNPTSGPTTGGTSVTITGTGFATSGVVTVTFGGTAATGISVGSATSITCTTPSHAAGAVDMVVTNPDAQPGTIHNGYTYTATGIPPAVSGVSPTSGPAAGGTSVTITGTNFVNGATVTFGGTAATGVTFHSATSLTCTTPPHAAGAVTVWVTNPDSLLGSLPNGFTYTGGGPAPGVLGVSPTSGPTAGGTGVAITGTNFANGAAVSFGGNPATGVSVVSPTSITCTTPAHEAGVVNLVVTNPDAQAGTLPNAFTYLAPTCKLVCASTVPTKGVTGTPVSFKGSATPTDCSGQPAYQWTFGDGATSSEQNPDHTYTTASVFSWSLAATLQGTSCTQYGSITVSPAVPPPVVTGVVKATDPFRLKVSGSNFHVGCTVKVNGVPVPTTKFKSSVLVVAKSGAAMKAMVPVGVPVQITVTNNDDGGVSTPFSYTR